MKTLDARDFAKKMLLSQPNGTMAESVNSCDVHFSWFTEGDIITFQLEQMNGCEGNSVYQTNECFISYKLVDNEAEFLTSEYKNENEMEFLMYAMGYSLNPPFWRTLQYV